jgi:hypothetical protein
VCVCVCVCVRVRMRMCLRVRMHIRVRERLACLSEHDITLAGAFVLVYCARVGAPGRRAQASAYVRVIEGEGEREKGGKSDRVGIVEEGERETKASRGRTESPHVTTAAHLGLVR